MRYPQQKKKGKMFNKKIKIYSNNKNLTGLIL
jgi:hypothetical protein